MEDVPFSKNLELCKDLELEEKTGQIGPKIAQANPAATPLTSAVVTQKKTLPGDPRVELMDPNICAILQEELITKRLNQLSQYFWLMTTQSAQNIRPLTEQLIQGRVITLTENPGLHLVWVNDRVFVKPLPKYLLSHAFWKYYLLSTNSPIQEGPRAELLQAARGFLRSYAYLIQHESDFRLAKEEKTRLVPEDISYADFAAFIVCCKVDDRLVSPRYQAGELRLTRLNFWSKVFLRQTTYYPVKWQYAAYFAQFYAPLLFIFAVFSLLLSAIQVILAVPTVLEPSDSWIVFARVARGIALFTVFVVACVIASLLLTLVVLVLQEIVYALKDRYRKYKKREALQDQENQGGHGVH